MKLAFWSICAAICLGCHGHPHPHAASQDPTHQPHAAAAEPVATAERPQLAFTHWTAVTELFVELPALIVGQPSVCVAHVTRLADFSALPAGRLTVVLLGSTGEERFAVDRPREAGIFAPIAVPATAGKRHLVVEIEADGLSARHPLGQVTVYASVAAAQSSAPEQTDAIGRIAVLKEQQWQQELATAVVAPASMQPTLRATGVLRVRDGGEALIAAPVAGRLGVANGAWPTAGQQVAVDAELAVLAPRLEAADRASLDLAVTQAQLQVRQADRERQRMAALHADGAVPERRVQEAEHQVAVAQANLAASRQRIAQFSGAWRAANHDQGAVHVQAPLTGAIVEVLAVAGSFVQAGDPLFRVIDPSQLWLQVQVPAIDAELLATPRQVFAQLEGFATPLALDATALVGRSVAVDPLTRTLSLFYAVNNANGRWPVGATAQVQVATGEPISTLAVPLSALVDDGGTPVVFVQLHGESFERRTLRTGIRDRALVAIASGLVAGERVVIRGAWSVKLAAASTVSPAHGHPH